MENFLTCILDVDVRHKSRHRFGTPKPIFKGIGKERAYKHIDQNTLETDYGNYDEAAAAYDLSEYEPMVTPVLFRDEHTRELEQVLLVSPDDRAIARIAAGLDLQGFTKK